MLFARRPLSVVELKDATDGDDDPDATSDLFSFEKNFILQTCGLLAIDAVSGTVHLVHKTARETLNQMAAASTLFSSAHNEMAETFLTLLSAHEVVDDCYAKQDYVSRSSAGVLLDYAAMYWGYHAREAAADEQTIQVLTTAFLNKLSWRRPNKFETISDDFQIPPEVGLGLYPWYWTTLHNLAYFGILG